MLPIIIGAVGGAAVYAAVEWFTQARSGRPMNWGKVGRAALVGGAFGAVGGGAIAIVARVAAKSAATVAAGSAPAVAIGQQAVADGGRKWIEGEPVIEPAPLPAAPAAEPPASPARRPTPTLVPRPCEKVTPVDPPSKRSRGMSAALQGSSR